MTTIQNTEVNQQHNSQIA